MSRAEAGEFAGATDRRGRDAAPAMTTRIANKLIRRSTLVDAMMDRYVDWREESNAVESAYRRWTESAARDRRFTFLAYSAALDREERASDLYRAAIAAYREVAKRADTRTFST